MKSTLIIIRGNSGSGKTVLAKELQNYFGTDKCLLLQQDVLRRNILHTNDHVGNPTIDLIADLAEFGKKHYPITILEGILRKDVYGDMLIKLCKTFSPNILIYYLDIPFEVTLRNNNQKETPFSTTQLRNWWRERDYLPNDTKFSDIGTSAMLEQIINDFEQLKK